MEQRYNMLRRLTTLYFYIGAIGGGCAVGIGILFFVITSINNEPIARTNAVVMVIGGLLFGLATIALSELIELLIATEENTRRTSILLQRLTARRDGSAPPNG